MRPRHDIGRLDHRGVRADRREALAGSRQHLLDVHHRSSPKCFLRIVSDRHPIAIEFVILIIAALARAEIGEIRGELDRRDPLDHLET
jgi:hypothetical protein